MASRNQIVRDMHDVCDEEFGGRHRTEAIQRVNALVEGYEVDRPRTEIQGLQLMRRAYREIAAEHESAQARNQRASATPCREPDSQEFKAGTLDQVKADTAARMKAGTYDPQAFAAPSL